MGFKVIVRKNGVQHGESHYTSEAVAHGMAKKMRNAGADVTLARCNGACCSGAQSNPRRNGAVTAKTTRAQIEHAERLVAQGDFGGAKKHIEAVYQAAHAAWPAKWAQAAILDVGLLRRTCEKAGVVIDRAKSNPRRNGSLSAARARLLAAQEAYALLRSHHGGSMISWAQYKRTVARMSPEAILAEAREDVTRQNPRRNGTTVPDCAWCGAECDQPRPYANWRGELFCSPSHRSSSNRALARLTGEGAPKKRTLKPRQNPRRNGTTAGVMAASRSMSHRNPGGAGVRAFSGRGAHMARADAKTQTSADKTRKVSSRNVRTAVGGGRYDVVRVHRMATRIAGTWQPAGETLAETEALAWLHGADRANPRARKNPSMDADTASTLIKQLGGSGKLVAMVGAKDFTRTERNGHPALSFKFKGSTKANYVNIALDPSDTYTLQFGKIIKYDLKPTGEFHGVHADQLKRTFEKFTGLYLSL